MCAIVATSIAVGGIGIGIDEDIVAIHGATTGDAGAIGADFAVFAAMTTGTAVRDIS